MITKRKAAAAVLDYVFRWTDWLATGDTITSATVTAESGLTVDSDAITGSGTTVTAWLSGGTAGTIYSVYCAVTTNDGRTETYEGRIEVY